MDLLRQTECRINDIYAVHSFLHYFILLPYSGFLESVDNVKVEPGRYKYVIMDAKAAEIMASAGCTLADVLAREGTMCKFPSSKNNVFAFGSIFLVSICRIRRWA